jgi:membrane protein
LRGTRVSGHGTGIGEWRQRALQFVQSDLWNAEAMAKLGMRRAQGFLQFCAAVVDSVMRDMIPLRASALTYYTVLAVVPLLAFALSIMQAVGANRGFVPRMVEQLTRVSPDAGRFILETVERVNFAQLGTIGAAVLFLTTLLGLFSIERAFNQIWGVTRARSLDRRITDYLAVLVIAPVLLGAALSLSATLQSQTLVLDLLEQPWFALLYDTGLRWAPVAFLALGFAFLYWFVPNTRVRVSGALLGGLVAAALFSGLQHLYVRFNVGVTSNNALYGGLAALPLFLAWVYVSWMIVLLGAEIAAALEKVTQLRRAKRGIEPSPAAREALGLAIAVRLARDFDTGPQPVSAEQLSEDLRLPIRSAREILADLELAGVAARSAAQDREDAFQLGRAADRIAVSELLDALRGPRGRELPPGAASPALARTLAEIDRRSAEAVADLTLEDLAREHGKSQAS